MNSEKVKYLLLGKWNSSEQPDLILEFESDCRYTSNKNPHILGLNYKVQNTDFGLCQLTAPQIGFYNSYILEINEDKLVIANDTSKV